MIVMKFGGTSVESAETLNRLAEIVAARRNEPPFVVVSAMAKTTNNLLAVGAAAAAGNREAAQQTAAKVRALHQTEGSAAVGPENQVALGRILDLHFAALDAVIERIVDAAELTPWLSDELTSLGERLSSHIVVLVLKHAGLVAHYVDARRVVVTDARYTRATPQLDLSYARIIDSVKALPAGCIPVMGGFIASTVGGMTTTLGRGGSDFSAAIAGAAVGAAEIQIWTDVDGMMTSDPRVVPEAQKIDSLSFDEAAELAYFGAKVLHPATLLPAIEHNIPVVILNSRRPEGTGTRIVPNRVPGAIAVKSVACKTNITVVDVRSTRMLMAHGFLRRIFEIFDRFETAVDMLATTEVSISLTIDNPEHLPEICAELQPFAEVSFESGQAIVCVVGDNLRHTPRVAARVFTALGDLNVRMISQGASRLNVSFVVAERDAIQAVKLLHREFFASVDSAALAQTQ